MGTQRHSGDDGVSRFVPDDAFFHSIVEHANETVVAFDLDGSIVYISPSCEGLIGFVPAEMIGTNIVDHLHPDDIERALYYVAQVDQHASVLSNGPFRFGHRDGSWVPVDVTAGHASDNGKTYFTAFARFSAAPQVERQVLVGLLDGAPLIDVLTPVLNTVSWQDIGSRIAIAWRDGDVWRHIDTGLPARLCGVEDDELWRHALETGEGTSATDLEGLDDELRGLAEAHGLGGYWIEPARMPRAGDAAIISLWTGAGRAEPRIHEIGIETAKSYVEVIFRFAAQRDLLDRAASHDPLTGLANRYALDSALEDADHGGALLYCDLDRFKPVNDEYGHAVGDSLLELVSRRLAGSIRDGDVVARIGGDEFVLLCPELRRDQAEQLAERLLETLSQPFTVDGRTIRIGVSIGIECAEVLDTAAIGRADLAMYAAKAAGHGTYRWAESLSG